MQHQNRLRALAALLMVVGSVAVNAAPSTPPVERSLPSLCDLLKNTVVCGGIELAK